MHLEFINVLTNFRAIPGIILAPMAQNSFQPVTKNGTSFGTGQDRPKTTLCN